MDRRTKLLDLLGAGLIAAALGAALAMMLADAFSLSVSFGQVALLCALTSLVMMVGGWSKWGRAFALVLGAVALVAALLPPGNLVGRLSQMLGAVMQLGGESEIAMSQYGPMLGMVLGVMLTAILYWMARMSGGVYPALTLSIILMMGSWFLVSRIQGAYALMALAALAAMFARASDEKISYMRALPAALIAAALALALVPPGGVTWPPLQQAAQKARELFNDYFLFTDPRTTYSISADGFQSRGEMLGGPAQPSMAQIMLVETDKTLLLRGSIKRTYTNYSWTESAVNSRYVFIDPTRRQVRDQVFDSTRLDGLNVSGAFAPSSADVTMLSSGISTLFVPHRITDFSAPLDLVTYFSSSGEVFITRGVAPGDHYQVSALIPTGDAGATRALLRQAASRADSGYRDQLAAYTALPQGIDQRVYQLAQRITQGKADPYDKALALQDHLMNNYTYNLEVDYPPSGKDFVSSFLLSSKEGYCSYFASAMAVMARIVGLPARYVEGYLVPVREGGATVVTGKNAHAWVEIYFEGAGWIAFNPTPGSGDSYQPPEGGGQAGDDQGGSDEGQGQDEPTPTPEPTQAPQDGDEGQEPHEGQAQQPEDQPEDEPQDEPEDQPEDQPEEAPEEAPEDDPWADEAPNLWWLWLLAILLPLAALVWFVFRRLAASDPKALTKGRKGAADKLAIWYRALLVALEQQGQVPGPGETPTQFAVRLTQAGLAGDALADVAKAISLNRYAGQKVDGAILQKALTAYDQLVAQLKPMERLRWLWQRVVHGLGSTQQIP